MFLFACLLVVVAAVTAGITWVLASGSTQPDRVAAAPAPPSTSTVPASNGAQEVIAYSYDRVTGLVLAVVPIEWWQPQTLPEQMHWICGIQSSFPQANHIAVTDDRRRMLYTRTVDRRAPCPYDVLTANERTHG